MDYEQLKLDNQLCFPLYAASRLITRKYQPYLDKLEITYPQYLVLMVLWEREGLTVNEITNRLILNTNTVTPLLKRMEKQNLVVRKRQKEDERKVKVFLTEKGINLKEKSKDIPNDLGSCIIGEGLSMKDILELKNQLNILIDKLME